MAGWSSESSRGRRRSGRGGRLPGGGARSHCQNTARMGPRSWLSGNGSARPCFVGVATFSGELWGFCPPLSSLVPPGFDPVNRLVVGSNPTRGVFAVLAPKHQLRPPSLAAAPAAFFPGIFAPNRSLFAACGEPPAFPPSVENRYLAATALKLSVVSRERGFG